MQGMALIEALVASAVLAMGLAGVTRLALHALQTANHTRQHTVAQALALQAMECLQSGLAPCEMDSVITVQGTRYTLQSQVYPRADLALLDLQVRIQWPAMGQPAASPTGASSSAADNASEQSGQWTLHSSRDLVPRWLGVSSP